VKVLRVHSTSDLEKARKRFCKEVTTWKMLRHPNVLPLLGVIENRLTMVSEWMRNGDINEFVKAHPDVNRLELLAGVTKGLMFIHDQGIVHGNLKGSNILVNNDGHACLADFGQITLFTDQSIFLSSYTGGGASGWMSPELLNPDESDPSRGRSTRESNCYALGMVIYEVLSGQTPFAQYSAFTTLRKVLGGGRPDRPEGVQGRWFTDDVWKMLEHCWQRQPNTRPGLDAVLRCLQDAAQRWVPPPDTEANEERED